ncbi:translation elongation factor Ts [Streptococcus macacae]|uniref:Elongation factor Ts n=1 Tax=Streptococcus macacae NCTC 11558 TaxID=764298 RepID=G5JW79_9STRE|nr:translation elongation factor Ts [Streptococcus macacae]EHJ52684.1 translation elongation factor Ts [Streptococcus macacae NCTC 11558]SUN79427.1 elongation factor Ts [Streptococcus macacae NCTC 11558]
MANITAALVKELREKTGAGVMDAKKALVEVEGDMEKAVELLREKGMAKAAKKADRVAAEGLTGLYVNGNVAAIVEVNAETDFVAKNAQFVDLVHETAKVIAEGKPATNDEALALKVASGETLAEAYVSATATIGEKISFRRFAIIEKTDSQHFGAYQHNGGRIGVISVIEGGDEALAKQLSMHIAAMSPKVLSYAELDSEFIHDELAQMNHKIEQDNESRAMVNKPALPFLKYGSKSQLTDEVIAQAEEDIKEELKAEGKPEKIWDKIIPGKMARFLLDNTKVDQEYTLLAQLYVMDDSKTVEEYLEDQGVKAIAFVRFEVGEGIEKAANDFENEVAATMAAALNN